MQPKILEVFVRNQMERTFSFRSDRNIWLGGKIVVLSNALLYPAYKNNNQTRGGLGRVGSGRCIGHVKCLKFQTGTFVEWKAP